VLLLRVLFGGGGLAREVGISGSSVCRNVLWGLE